MNASTLVHNAVAIRAIPYILFVWLIIYEPLEIEVVPVLHRIYAIADEDGEGYPGDFLPIVSFVISQ